MSTILIPAATDLAGLNAILAQMEEADGPLTAMGNDGANTTLTFDDAGTNPTVFAVIAASTATPPAGATTVCSGTIYIAGTQTVATATRAAS
jgi:hypothetical protein